MFTIQTAVTIVTASLAANVFGVSENLVIWSLIITFLCFLILLYGKYNLLDKIIKWIILLLTISTLIAVVIAVSKNTAYLSYKPIIPQGTELIFLIAFMGWMPAPLDISIWHSLWTIEKNKKLKKIKINIGLQDFNVGYFTTIFLGICFMGLGALVMFNSNTEFSESGSIFADQLINLYTSNLGENFYIFIAIAALTTMFSTSLTTLDASPRAMEKASELLFPRLKKLNYLFWISSLSIGTCLIFLFLLSEMGKLVQIATVLSFITAPFYAILNYVLVTSKQMPEKYKPKKFIKILSLMGIIFLSTFSIGYLIIVLKL